MVSKWISTTLVATVVAAGSYYLGNPENREKITETFNQWKEKVTDQANNNSEKYLSDKIGHSDPYDTEDNTMIDEGAVFSVNYYDENKIQQ